MIVGSCYFLLTLLTPYDQNIDFCIPLRTYKENVLKTVKITIRELKILKKRGQTQDNISPGHTLVCFFDVVELAESQLEDEEEEEEKADEMGLWESTRARTYSFT